MLKALDTLGHFVTVLAIDEGNRADTTAYFEGTRVRLKLFNSPGSRPLVERKIRSIWRSGWEISASAFGHAARKEADSGYDAVLAEDICTARTLEGRVPLVLSLLCLRHIDMRAVAAGNTWKSRLRVAQVRRAECAAISRASHVRVLSKNLEKLTRALVPRAATSVIPLCIDTALYEPVIPPVTPTIGVIGSMHWEPSREAAIRLITHIAPRLRSTMSDIRFLVAGWGAQRFLMPYINAEDITVIEDFDDPREIFSKLSVLVYAPHVGTGMKVKVMEAMAYGVPAVVNEHGFEGFEVAKDVPVRVTHSDKELVDTTAELLSSRDLRDDFATRSRECLKTYFSPIVIAQSLVDLLSKNKAAGY